MVLIILILKILHLSTYSCFNKRQLESRRIDHFIIIIGILGKNQRTPDAWWADSCRSCCSNCPCPWNCCIVEPSSNLTQVSSCSDLLIRNMQLFFRSRNLGSNPKTFHSFRYVSSTLHEVKVERLKRVLYVDFSS